MAAIDWVHRIAERPPGGGGMTDLRIAHCEITQGIQVHDNAVPLVAGKPTVIRVFPHTSSSQPIPGVTAKLYASRPDTGDQYTPIDPGHAPISVSGTVWRGDPHCSLDFLLEPSWCEAGRMAFRAVLQPPSGDPTQPSHTRTITVEFHLRRPLRVRYLLITHDKKPPGAGLAQSDLCAFLRSVFPVAPLDVSYEPASVPALTFDDKTKGGYIDDAALMQELNLRFLGDPTADAVYGWIHKDVFPYFGRSDPQYLGGKGLVAFGTTETARRRRTLAHELGHNAYAGGLFHPADHPDSSYWYPAQLEDDQYGYDVMGIHPSKQKVLRTRSNGQPLYDMMAPARLEEEAWIGPGNYARLFQVFVPAVPAAGGPSSLPGPGNTPNTPGPPRDAPSAVARVVHGAIRVGGDARIAWPHPVPDSPKLRALLPHTRRGAGTVSLRFYADADGRAEELRDLRIEWEPRFTDVEGNPSDAWFVWPISAWSEDVASIALVGAGGTLAKIAGTRDERVEIPADRVEVNGDEGKGELRLTWHARQTHREHELYQQVYYRNRSRDDRDGALWHLIATALTSAQTTVRFPVTDLPGGPGGELLIVAASGFAMDEQVVTTDHLHLTVPPDSARIVAPCTGTAIASGEHFLLAGYALDAARRRVDPRRLHWSVEPDGGGGSVPVGGGEQAVCRHALSAGAYKVRLALDEGRAAQVKIQITS
jgi:hypothetical protein